MNIDINIFDPDRNTSSCKHNGLYFTEFNKMCLWLNYNKNGPMYNCNRVIIPNEAKVYIEEDKLKTDMFILDNKIPIHDLDLWNDYESCFHAVRLNPGSAIYIKEESFTTYEKNALLEETMISGYYYPSAYMEVAEEPSAYMEVAEEPFVPIKCFIPEINFMNYSDKIAINCGINNTIKKLYMKTNHKSIYINKHRLGRSNVIFWGCILLLNCMSF